MHELLINLVDFRWTTFALPAIRVAQSMIRSRSVSIACFYHILNK